MRLIIIPVDTKISIDGEPITGCDMSWVPEFVGDITGVSQKVHAVQWYDDHGEIELVSRDSNIEITEITELGVFEQAVSIHAEKKAILEAEAAAEAEAEKVAADLEAEQEALLYGGGVDIDQLLAELESDDNNENVGIAST
jgi:hypothetical protein